MELRMPPVTDPTDVLYHPLNVEHTGNPEERLATARATCPVSTPIPRVHVVATNELVRDVLASPEKFANVGNFTITPDPPVVEKPMITSMDPPVHTEFRHFMRRWFSPLELRKQEARIEQIVSRLIEPLATGDEIEFVERIANTVPAWTVYAFVGLPEADWTDIQHWTDTIHNHLPHVPDDLPEQIAFFRYLDEQVAQRAAHGTPQHDDLIDGLVFAPGMTPAEVVSHIAQVLSAGTATTASLITNLFYELLHDRGNWERLVADPSLVTAAIEESLRHDAPLQYALRTVTEDTEIGGCPVAAGDRLVVSLQSANWDEEVWGPDAGDFDLGRGTPQQLLSFGVGIHTCLGAPLARLETKVVLRRFVAAFPGMRLAPGFERHAMHDPMLRRPETLDVVL
jgi:cytochrome P450